MTHDASNINSDQAYDEVPYASYPFTDSHPSRLAAIAQFFGLNPPALENARILELGSASGGNIIPLTFYYPNMKVVGIDYSKVQIDDGKAIIEKLGIKNVELIHMSVADITPDFGQFDYIICHGVYSWVPQEVQDAILRVCNENLSENGIAYISYNTYPGWKTREITRDAMLFHTRNIPDRLEKVAHGRGMIQYMQEMSGNNKTFQEIMNKEAELINNSAAYYVAHEFLETHNSPCYFHEFNSRAESFGLTYLSETSLPQMFAQNLGVEHQQRLLNVSGGEQVVLEQYIDFIVNRTFRQTLLVKNTNNPQIKRAVDSNNLKKLSYQCFAQIVPNKGATPAHMLTYESPNKNSITVESELHKTILDLMIESQFNPMSYTMLKARLDQKLGNPIDEQELLIFLEKLLITAIVMPWNDIPSEQYINGHNPTPDYPKLNSLVAQYALLNGHFDSYMHIALNVNPITTVLAPLLDGTRNIPQLVIEMIKAVDNNQVHFQKQGSNELITDPIELAKEAEIHIKNQILNLLSHGLLMQ